MNEHSVKLLWTGGWDSTFRLLQLIEKGAFTEPYYIIDTSRPSTMIEIETLTKLRDLIVNKLPEAKNLIGDLNFYSIHEIQADKSITTSFLSLKSEAHLGGQYNWLARFAKQHKINNLELAIHEDDKARFFLDSFVVRKDTEIGDTFYIKPDGVPEDVRRLFKYYRFPLFNYSKVDMDEYAQKNGWTEIMKETWFCHTPSGNKPCGICNPCRYTIEEGMGRRLPALAKVRYRARYFYDTVDFFKKAWKYLSR